MDKRMIENKQAFVAALSIALREFDAQRTNVRTIRLELVPSLVPDAYEEQIRIEFFGGGTKVVPATGNSNLANMFAIAKALI